MLTMPFQKSVGRKPFIIYVDRLGKYEGLVPASMQRLADETMKAGASTVWSGTNEAESGRRGLAEEQESQHEARCASAIKPCLRAEEVAGNPLLNWNRGRQSLRLAEQKKERQRASVMHQPADPLTLNLKRTPPQNRTKLPTIVYGLLSRLRIDRRQRGH